MLVQQFATHSDHFQKYVFPVFKSWHLLEAYSQSTHYVTKWVISVYTVFLGKQLSCRPLQLRLAVKAPPCQTKCTRHWQMHVNVKSARSGKQLSTLLAMKLFSPKVHFVEVSVSGSLGFENFSTILTCKLCLHLRQKLVKISFLWKITILESLFHPMNAMGRKTSLQRSFHNVHKDNSSITSVPHGFIQKW